MLYLKTTATKKLLALTNRIRGIAGGTSASKTVSILLILIQYAMKHKNQIISVVSESMPHLRKGAMRDFINILESHNYFKQSEWNTTNSVYTFSKTKSIIEFFGVESWEKVKGARRDVLFINEANHIDYNSYTQMEVRTKDMIWLDWNPESEFWWYTDVLPNGGVDFITLTYKDNEGLDQNIIDAIESRRGNANWWKVYGEGQLGEVEARIFTGWEIIDSVPHQAELRRRGLDFGYTNDPTALLDIYYYNGGYIFDEILYRYGMTNKDIADVINNLNGNVLVKADSAEPKSIDEIKRYGINIMASQKGQGSVNQGIQYIKGLKISMTKKSINLIKEYRNYLWQTDKDGKIINEPQEFMNHLMDAARYGLDGAEPKKFKMPTSVGGIKPFFPGIG